jgi:TrwC relaxase
LPEELRRFSTRRAEILAAAGEGASARAMQIATLETWQQKGRDLTTESLREAWRAKGAEIGLDREAIGDRLGHERPGLASSSSWSTPACASLRRSGCAGNTSN